MSDNGSNSDWIYLLLTLIAGIASLFKAQKTKKRQVGDTPDSSETPDPFLETEEEDGALVQATEWPDSRIQSNCLTVTDKQEESNGLFKEEVSLEEEETESYAFDLRQAIISNEILNRKYD